MQYLRLFLSIITILVINTFSFSKNVDDKKVVFGKASFYAKSLNNHRTASGERHRSDSLVCAHKSYPFGTLLKVTNLRNGQEVVVKVNDRGPFIKGRIVDLSYRAAKEIGMLNAGVVEVKVEIYQPQEKNPFRNDSTIIINSPIGSIPLN